MKEEYYEDEICNRCYGDGQIVICWDDLCAGTDRCIHGDGYGMCPDCQGSGMFIPKNQADKIPVDYQDRDDI